MDDHGTITINIDRFIARGGLNERTLQNYLKKAEKTGWLFSAETWWLQKAEQHLRGKAWRQLSITEKKRAIRQTLTGPSRSRDRTYFVSEAMLQGPMLFKPRSYILRGWSDYRHDLATRHLVNGLCLALMEVRQGQGRMGAEIVTNRWGLRKKVKAIYGRVPEFFDEAIANLMQDGILLQNEGDEIRFHLDNLNRPAPGALQGDRTMRLRLDTQRKLELDAARNKSQITLLMNLVQRRLIRERDLTTFLNVLENNHPYLLSDKRFKHLVDWMLAQSDTGRPSVGWRKLLTDYVARYIRHRPQIVSLPVFHFERSTANGDEVIWHKPSKPHTALVLRWRMRPTTIQVKPLAPRLALKRGEAIYLLGNRNAWSKHFYGVADISQFLKNLTEGEYIAVFAAVARKDSELRIESQLVVHFQ
jgi:hypothetical protein